MKFETKTILRISCATAPGKVKASINLPKISATQCIAP